MLRRFRSLLISGVVSIVVIGLFCVFLMNQGKWEGVVTLASDVVGVDFGQKLDKFGQGSRDALEDANEYGQDIKDRIEAPGYEEIVWPDLSKVLDALNPIPKTEPRHPDYARDEFGSAWLDVDKNGCDTRNDILQRDLTHTTLDADGCTVLRGTLNDPYTGNVIEFTRGRTTSSAVQIDHMIPLSLAWDLGAWKWDDAKRKKFANDPENLLAVDGSANGSKSDSPISEWMPEDESFHCAYTAAYVHISSKYDLAMQEKDQKVADQLIAACS